MKSAKALISNLFLFGLAATVLACSSASENSGSQGGQKSSSEAQDKNKNKNKTKNTKDSSKNSDNDSNEEEPSTDENQGSGSSLTGTWRSCQPTSTPHIQSSMIEMTFSDSKLVSMTRLFRDQNCQTAPTEEDFQKYGEEYKKYLKSNGVNITDSEINAMIADMKNPPTSNSTYKVGKELSDGAIEIDISYANEGAASGTDYVAFKVSQNTLKISSVCNAEMVQNKICPKEEGTSPSKRSVQNFAMTLQKN